MEFSNLNKKAKKNWILVVVVNCHHRENGLFLINLLKSFLDFIIAGILIFCFTIFSFKVAVLSFTLFPIRLLCLFFLLLLASLIGTLATVCMKKEEEPQPLSGYRRLSIAAYYILNYLCLLRIWMTYRQDTWDPCLKNWDLAKKHFETLYLYRWKERQKMTVTYLSWNNVFKGLGLDTIVCSFLEPYAKDPSEI